MALLLYTFLGLVALGSIVTVYAALTAKEGYEDADGFHAVLPEAEASARGVSAAVTVRR